MPQQEPIVIFPRIEILPPFTKEHVIQHLKGYCRIDNLGDTIYIEKPGSNKTTFAIDFVANEITIVRKIKDENGNDIENEIIFKSDSYDGSYDSSHNNNNDDDDIDFE